VTRTPTTAGQAKIARPAELGFVRRQGFEPRTR
jgi:hypothetical protein